MDNFLEVLNFNRSFLKLNQFISNGGFWRLEFLDVALRLLLKIPKTKTQENLE